MSPESPSNSRQEQDALLKRLDVIISLLVEWNPTTNSERSAFEQTVRLARVGLETGEVARIMGRQGSNVSRDISKARKEGLLPRE